MSDIAYNSPRARSWFAPAVILLILTIFGTTILLARHFLYQGMSEQIARRDAAFLYALCIGPWVNSDDPTVSPASAEDQFAAIVQIQKLRQLAHLLATRLYDADGKPEVAVPANVADGQISDADLRSMQALAPICHFNPKGRLDQLFWLEPAATPSEHKTFIPLQTVLVPLHAPKDRKLRGIAEFVLNGQSLAEEYQLLRQRLNKEAAIAFFAFGTLISSGLGFAFYKLQHLNHLLEHRTRSLLRANQDLAMAAKTSAVGSVTAHLIHGLKNPLFGLQNFISSRESSNSQTSDTEWELAANSARRMQQLVNDVVRVLREENGIVQYDVSLLELADILENKLRPLAAERGVELAFLRGTDAILNNRYANLITLILENLAQNALQATTTGKSVQISFASDANAVRCEVRDQGQGLTDAVRQNLFNPCTSTKPGGSGIGLCISKQLAHHLGASLELTETGPAGTVFTLRLPVQLFQSQQTSTLAPA